MADCGYIKLYRKFRCHPFWKEKRTFSRAEAWEDILMSANFADSKEMIKGKIIEYKRGEWYTSELKLCDRWGWSRKKVRSFLSLLENEKMCHRKGTTEGTTLTIVNYDLYQSEDTAKDTPEDTTEGTAEGTQNKKNKNNKKGIIYTPEFKQFCTEYPNVMKEDQTFKSWKALLRKGVLAEHLIIAAKNYTNYCKAKNMQEQFIYYSSNFLGRAAYYKDYINGGELKEYGTNSGHSSAVRGQGEGGPKRYDDTW